MMTTTKIGDRGSHNLRVATIENGDDSQVQRFPRVKLVLRRQAEFGYGNYRWFGVDPKSSIIFPIDDLWAETIEEAIQLFREAYPQQVWKSEASWL